MPWNLRKMFVENSWNPGCSISVTSQWACHDPKMLISHHYSRIFQISVIISPVVFTPQCIQSNPWGPKLTCNGDDTVIFGGYGHFRGEHGHGDSFKLSKIIANWENHWYIYILYNIYIYIYIYICGPIYILSKCQLLEQVSACSGWITHWRPTLNESSPLQLGPTFSQDKHRCHWPCNVSIEKWPFYSGFSHWKWWFSIVMLNYQRV